MAGPSKLSDEQFSELLACLLLRDAMQHKYLARRFKVSKGSIRRLASDLKARDFFHARAFEWPRVPQRAKIEKVRESVSVPDPGTTRSPAPSPRTEGL